MTSNLLTSAVDVARIKLDSAEISCWDALAPYWSVWERLGMTEQSLLPFSASLRPPILVIGAGHGIVLGALREQGLEAIGIDSSAGMVKMAKFRRSLDLVLGRAEALPFNDNYFATVILTNSVLDIAKPLFIDLILSESRRVILSKGLVLAGFFSPSKEVHYTANKIGYMTGWHQHQHRLYSIWNAGRNPARWTELVSQWTGCSYVTAARRAKQWQQVLEVLFDSVEKLAIEVDAQGGDPLNVLKKGLDFELLGTTPERAIALLDSYGFRCHKTYGEASVSTLTVGSIMDS